MRGADVGLGAVWCHTLRCVGGERESAGTGHTEACSPRPPCPYTRVCLQHHTPALQGQEWTDVSLLSVVICAVAMAQSFSASEQGGGVSLVRGPGMQAPTPELQTRTAHEHPKRTHLVVFLHLILPVLSFPASSWLVPANPSRPDLVPPPRSLP